MKTKKILKSIFFIFAPLLLGSIVGFLFVDKNFYKNINKPILSPPSLIFILGWTLFYILMGLGIFLVNKEKNDKKANFLFLCQLIINLIYPILFFYFKFYIVSSLWIILLLYFVVLMIDKFYRIKKIAAYLQFPYFLWLLFALYLNIGIALLN